MPTPFTARYAGISATVFLAALALSGCVPKSTTVAGTGAATLGVDSSASACTVSAATARSGSLTFAVKNSGNQATEFYLLAADGKRVVGEVEDIGPGLTRNLVVDVSPGQYFTVCKPGLTGDGIGRTAFTVTE
ncbi:MAG: hypothetical protein ABI238_03820 [Terrimesophilobacter sp.]